MYNCIIHAIFIWLLFRVLSFCPSFFFVVLIVSWGYLVFTCNWKVLKLSRNVISSKISWRVPYYYLQEHPNPCYVTLVRDIIMVYCTERVTWSYDTLQEAIPRLSQADVDLSRNRISVFLSTHTAYELLPESGKVGLIWLFLMLHNNIWLDIDKVSNFLTFMILLLLTGNCFGYKLTSETSIRYSLWTGKSACLNVVLHDL